MRAISLRTACSRPWLSSWPVAAWKRRLNSSILASASWCSSSSSVEALRSAAASPLAITPDVPGHGDTGGLDLPVGDVGVLHGLDAVFAERHPGPALGGTVPVRPVLLAGLNPAGDEHVSALLARCGRPGRGRQGLLLRLRGGRVGAVGTAGCGTVGP